jgi:hypothetical protein
MEVSRRTFLELSTTAAAPGTTPGHPGGEVLDP